MKSKHTAVIQRNYRKLFRLKHVIGLGYGRKEVRGRATKEMAIMVLVDKKLPVKELGKKDLVPQTLKSLPTDVIEVGELKIQSRKDRLRPAQPGVSIGHYLVSAGTLGAIVKDVRTGKPYILSNNHVLANQTSGFDGRARYGDPILQPGSYDHGTTQDDILGYLDRYIPVAPNYQSRSLFSLFRPAVRNLVDCALARPIAEDAVDNRILDIGEVRGVVDPSPGMWVVKSGRTTGVTRGRVKAIDGVVEVGMDGNTSAIFEDQIITDPLSEGGDSGSLVLDHKNKAVGLLFAGSNKASVCNKISNVLKSLSIEF